MLATCQHFSHRSPGKSIAWNRHAVPNIAEAKMATFLRIGALADRLGISIRTVHDRIRTDPHFPQPVRLGSAPQSPLGFVTTEVERYEAHLMAARAQRLLTSAEPQAA